MRSGAFRRGWSALAIISLFALIIAGAALAVTINKAHAAPVTGAAFTTVNETVDGSGHCLNGNPSVNCNIYDGKDYVWLNGGPVAASLGDGKYFFAVLDPGSQANPNDGATGNLSDTTATSSTDLGSGDLYTNRTFTISGGTISYSGSHDFNSNKIRLMPYDDTSNPGGVYILAICSLANGYPVTPSACKYDAFKVQTGEVQQGLPLDITKDANGAYTNTYTWSIQKDVDKTLVKQVGGNATFNYTVTVTHDGGTISDVKVSGTIQVYNSNTDSSNNTVGVAITGVTDTLSNGVVCAVTNGGSQTLTQFTTDFPYTCDLSALPQGQLDNTATVTWPQQTLSGGASLAAGSADFTFSNIVFTPTLVDNCVTVTDTFNGTMTTLGAPCVGDANPTVYTYSHTVPVPQYDCVTYDNTATFTTNTTGTTGSASQSVTVCGPARTGALTMGFWQNKNGQGIIKATGSTAGVCNLTTWLRLYTPYQDLSGTTCADAATYVYNVIKAANAGGATMNAMLKAQMLATALDVYYSDPALGGNQINAPAPISGVKIDLTMICAPIQSSGGTVTCGGYENVSAAFGGASSMTVSDMLAYAASQSNVGGSFWYGQVKATQGLAKDAFDAINNQVAFSA